MSEQRVVRPQDVLAPGVEHVTIDGVEVRKGTVGAFVTNAMMLEQLDPSGAEYSAVLDVLRELAPKLRAVGLLDVFIPRSPRIAELFES